MLSCHCAGLPSTIHMLLTCTLPTLDGPVPSEYCASASAVVQHILDIGLHAAPVGVPVIMICCIITACTWLRPTGIKELTPNIQKIAGETEVVAFDKTGKLETGGREALQPATEYVRAQF